MEKKHYQRADKYLPFLAKKIFSQYYELRKSRSGLIRYLPGQVSVMLFLHIYVYFKNYKTQCFVRDLNQILFASNEPQCITLINYFLLLYLNCLKTNAPRLTNCSANVIVLLHIYVACIYKKNIYVSE